MANYIYSLGPLVQSTKGIGGWEAPEDSILLIDFGSNVDQSINATRSNVLFASTKSLGSKYNELATGDCREINVNQLMRDKWFANTKYLPSGDKLVDLIWDHLTNGTASNGLLTCKPLMPTVAGVLELHLPGHSLVKSEKFDINIHSHKDKVMQVLQNNFDIIYILAKNGKLRDKSGKIDLEHHRKVLD